MRGPLLALSLLPAALAAQVASDTAAPIGRYVPVAELPGTGRAIDTAVFGMVFTIEPGVYLPDEGLGVRIEDDVLVTATGAEWLSAGAPRTPEEIERAMRRR